MDGWKVKWNLNRTRWTNLPEVFEKSPYYMVIVFLCYCIVNPNIGTLGLATEEFAWWHKMPQNSLYSQCKKIVMVLWFFPIRLSQNASIPHKIRKCSFSLQYFSKCIFSVINHSNCCTMFIFPFIYLFISQGVTFYCGLN